MQVVSFGLIENMTYIPDNESISKIIPAMLDGKNCFQPFRGYIVVKFKNNECLQMEMMDTWRDIID